MSDAIVSFPVWRCFAEAVQCGLCEGLEARHCSVHVPGGCARPQSRVRDSAKSSLSFLDLESSGIGPQGRRIP